MNQTRSLELEPQLHNTAELIKDYQPTYPDVEAFDEAVLELLNTTPATTIANIKSLKTELAEVSSGNKTLYIAGRCTNRVDAHSSIEDDAAESLALYDLINDEADNAVVALRDGRGQSSKPRTSDTETLPDGTVVETYKGDSINGYALSERTPDPSRMVATALQARDIDEMITQEAGKHVYATHEALLLPYEESFIREDEAGRKYLLSGDTAWVGERTRNIGGKHVDLLRQVENPVGVKISHKATAEDIKDLAQTLNPGDKPGKLIFMLRLGVDNLEKLPELLGSIKEYAPNAIIMCDASHGNTKVLADGRKTRLVSDSIEEIRVVSETCKEMGLKLGGIHLEAMGTDDRKECIDEPGELPTHQSEVDPNYNLSQLRRIVRETRQYL